MSDAAVERRTPAGGLRPPVGWTLSGVAVLALLAVVVTDSGGPAGDAARLGLTVGAALLAWLGRRIRSLRRGQVPWISVTLTLNACGDVTWQVLSWLHQGVPGAGPADALRLVGYGTLAAALLAGTLGGRRWPGATVHAVLDSCALGTVAALVVVQSSAWDQLSGAGHGAVTRVVWSAYPVLDALLVGLLAWRVVLHGRVRVAALVGLLGAVCWTVADFSWLFTAGLDDAWGGAGRLTGSLLLAVVPWLRSTPGTRSATADRPVHGPWRIALNLLPFAVPAIAEVIGWTRGVDVNPLPGLVVWAVLLVIASIRTRALARDGERAWAAVRSQARRSEALAATSSDAVAVVDPHGRLTADSPSLSDLLGVPAPAGAALADLVAPLCGDPAALVDLLARTRARPGVPLEVEVAGRRPGGDPLWLWLRAVDLGADPDVAGTAVSVAEITRRKTAEQALAHQAFHDGLTGLANRSLFLDHAEQALRRAGRSGVPPIVLCMDLDGFKDVNDSLGHLAGDELLRVVATRLAGVVRAADTVARLGGDEFAVLLEDPCGDGLAGAADLAARLLAAITVPVELHGQSVTVAASIGIVAADPAATPLSLLQDADIAMYRAKAAGRAQWVVFEPGMRAEALERIALERDLAGALGAGQLRLVYQPVVDLRSERVVGFEALLRWRHPTLGPVGPDRFVPAAEAAGLIVPIGRWVLAEACGAAARWQRAHPGTPLTMAVNVSARQLAAGSFLGDVAQALATSGIQPCSLVLEVTETALVTDPEAVAQRLAELHTLGVRIALDDFGTGYSSLSYLRQFPVDILKIDKSFVDLLSGSAGEAAIVHGLVQLSRTLRLEIVAEGVELPVQRDRLRAEHCHLAQGFLFSPPLEAEDAELLLLGASSAAAPRS